MSIKYKLVLMFIFPIIVISWLEINKHQNNLLGEFPSFHEAFRAGFWNYLFFPLIFFMILGGRNKNLEERGYLMIAMLLLLNAPGIIITLRYGNYKYLSFQAGGIFSIFIGFFIVKNMFKYLVESSYAISEKILNSLDNESIEFVRANGMKIFMGHYFEHNPKEDESAQNTSIIVINKIICPVINSILRKEKISLKEIQEPGFIRSLVALSHILQEERALREETAVLYPKLENDAIKIPNLTPKRHKLMRAEEVFKNKLKHFERYLPKNVEFSNI